MHLRQRKMLWQAFQLFSGTFHFESQLECILCNNKMKLEKRPKYKIACQVALLYWSNKWDFLKFLNTIATIEHFFWAFCIQSEERQMAQRWFVAAKPMNFEKNVTNVSCRYGQIILRLWYYKLWKGWTLKYTIHFLRNQNQLLHNIFLGVLNVKWLSCLG